MESDPDLLRRRIIDSIVSHICINHGFVRTELNAVETLSEMFIAFICQLSVQTKLYAELQGRTENTLHDVASALTELGVSLRSIYRYIRTLNPHSFAAIAPPSYASNPKPPQVLHAIKPRPHFHYINDHFPPFPDPHTYILTECGVRNERDYVKSRELVAEQKLCMEKDLVNLRLRNELLRHESRRLSVFQEDTRDTSLMLIPNECPIDYECCAASSLSLSLPSSSSFKADTVPVALKALLAN